MFFQTLITKAKNLLNRNRAALKKTGAPEVIKVPSPKGPYKSNKPKPKPNREQVRAAYNSQKGRPGTPFPFTIKHGRAIVRLAWWNEIGTGFALLKTYDKHAQTVRVMFGGLGAHINPKTGKIVNGQGVPLSASVRTCHLSELKAG